MTTRTRKPMTEPEAWRDIARQYAGRQTTMTCSGLCLAVRLLTRDGDLDALDMRQSMLNRIEAHLSPASAGWYAYTATDDAQHAGRDHSHAQHAGCDHSREARDARCLAALWLALDAEAEGK